MSDVPVIGLCTALERARWAAWEMPAALLPFNYAEAVQRAGGLALMLPPDRARIDDPDPVLDLLDGLVLAGGSDIHPQAYGAEQHPATEPTSLLRDDFEVALARRALERDMPFLGICRGMQVLNIAQGGTLQQHLPDAVGSDRHRLRSGTFDGNDHDVRLRDGSLAARAAGEAVHATKSHHHQGVDALGDGLAVTGWDSEDDSPEAIESADHRYVLGVQWHPEADEASRLIGSLVAEARAWRAERTAAA